MGNAADLMLPAVDLFILVGTAAILLVFFVRRKSVNLQFRDIGLALFGLALGLVAFSGQLLLMIRSTLPGEAGITSMSGTLLPDWLHWLLTRSAFLLVMAGLLLAELRRRQDAVAMQSFAQTVSRAADCVRASEARFRSLFDTSQSSLFCYTFDPPLPIDLPLDEQVRRSHDAVLTECNQYFAAAVGLPIEELIGTRMGILDGNKDAAAHFDYFGSFVKNDYRLSDYELIYKTPEGDDRALRSSLTGIVSGGLLYRFWGAESDLLDLRQSQAALASRADYQRILSDISSRLVTANEQNGGEVLEHCVQTLCRFFGADRSTLLWHDIATGTTELGIDWSERDHNFLLPESMAPFPQIVKRLLRSDVVQISDIDALPAEFDSDRRALLAQGFRAAVILPLVVDGQARGSSAYMQQHDPRTWTEKEVADMQVFASLLANFVLRLLSVRALNNALSELRRATERLEAENVYLRDEIKVSARFDEIVGDSPALLHCLKQVDMVADTLTTVLILGETGTGKELIARAIHKRSSRNDRALVKVNCAALPANLIESELFGYEKGAFTGADRIKLGRFDLAHGSTLFLDEIGDLPLELQGKLLRVLQEGEFVRLGGGKTIKVDVRIVAATNRDLLEAVGNGSFRSDLYYRISAFPIEMPSLRSRGGDIRKLAEHFVKVQTQNLGREISAISADMMRQMRDYDWPGNVRELEGVIQRAIISSSGPILELAGSLGGRQKEPRAVLPQVLRSNISGLRQIECDHIVDTLQETSWKIAGPRGAAVRLGIPASTLRSKMKKLGIERRG